MTAGWPVIGTDEIEGESPHAKFNRASLPGLGGGDTLYTQRRGQTDG